MGNISSDLENSTENADGRENTQPKDVTQSQQVVRFTNSTVGISNYDMTSKKVSVIDTKEEAEITCHILRYKATIYVDCEGNHFGNMNDSQIGLIQIATDENCCFLFDVITCPDCLIYLKPILESKCIRKVFHDCSGDSAALYKEGIILTNVEDTQVAQKVIDYTMNAYSIEDLYEKLLHRRFPVVNRKKISPQVNNMWIDCRPMTDKMIMYGAIDVLTLPEIFSEQESEIPDMELYRKLVLQQMDFKRKLRVNSITKMQSEFSCASESQDSSYAGQSGHQQKEQESTNPLLVVLGVGAAVAGAIALISAFGSAGRESNSRD